LRRERMVCVDVLPGAQGSHLSASRIVLPPGAQAVVDKEQRLGHISWQIISATSALTPAENAPSQQEAAGYARSDESALLCCRTTATTPSTLREDRFIVSFFRLRGGL
jgi:hypothetical protein